MRKRRKVISKNMIEVLDYHTSRTYRRNGKRVKRKCITPDAQKRNNEKQAEVMLRMLIDNNFNTNDCYLTLTYREQPETWDDAKKDIQNFIRRLKRRYKKLGKELKYIYVAEGKTRIHFHMIINNAELYSDEINELWSHGMHKLMLYQGRAEDAVKLARYFIKEKRSACYSEKDSTFKRRWNSSKNLEKPKVKTEILKPSEWRDYIQPPNGYYVETDSVVEDVSEEGYPYRFYRLIKIEEVKSGITRNRNSHRDSARNGNSFSMRN